jgi:hypothetical protein
MDADDGGNAKRFSPPFRTHMPNASSSTFLKGECPSTQVVGVVVKAVIGWRRY